MRPARRIVPCLPGQGRSGCESDAGQPRTWPPPFAPGGTPGAAGPAWLGVRGQACGWSSIRGWHEASSACSRRAVAPTATAGWRRRW